jgi:peptidoglycan-associated lipoprotein
MNQMFDTKLWYLFAVAALAVGTGCQSTGSTTQTTTQAAPTPVEPTNAVAGRQPVPAEPELQTVYFEYDRWELRDDAQRALRSNAQLLQANSASDVVTVMGHCDERGSEEYNLALGERRAEAVKRYLMDLGVPASRLRTLSLGEARPAVPGVGDAAWSRNRRAELSLATQQASR